MKAATRLDAIAAANGYTRTERKAGDVSIGQVTYQRGRRYIDVVFSLTGSVVSASHARGRVSGTGKAEAVAAFLSATTLTTSSVITNEENAADA